MTNLHEIIDFSTLANPSFGKTRTIDTRIGTNFYIIFDNDFSKMRYFFVST